ncbi:hypothetical protein EVAR_14725_1 [Eumeta japonica]|uniref:Uncharacterized protein n=1 Tax=Eumeta variegata TaxID=151549 RepID=A0A4C1TWA6_EUMVA|nr:hypothetical protein EVAR_14725_1 [Eumeta japonica]
MTQNRNEKERKEGSGSVVPAHCIIRRQFRAAEFRALLSDHLNHFIARSSRKKLDTLRVYHSTHSISRMSSQAGITTLSPNNSTTSN